MLIKWCKIQYLNLDKTFVFRRNQVICQKNWKLWRAPTTVQFNIFAEILRTFPSDKCLQKVLWDVLFRSWFINKTGSCECVETRYFLILANKSSSKQNKKTSTLTFVDIDK